MRGRNRNPIQVVTRLCSINMTVTSIAKQAVFDVRMIGKNKLITAGLAFCQCFFDQLDRNQYFLRVEKTSVSNQCPDSLHIACFNFSTPFHQLGSGLLRAGSDTSKTL